METTTTMPMRWSPAIDGVDVLVRLVAAEGEGRPPSTVRRYERVLAHLLLFLDHVDVQPQLGVEAAAALAAERDVGREGAFFRVLGLDDLMACLPVFLQPGWLAVRSVERRTQVSLVARLVRALQAEGRVTGDLRPWRAALRSARQIST
ncbi:hypothetical protein ACHAAC_07570 [Aeromicrobium sp. CF4.19]|uniref:hypothetical protein n=1 Tax=Aeromicrobium sp. CF4.19 TaxID=3373082 RepID=UPI003EE58156